MTNRPRRAWHGLCLAAVRLGLALLVAALGVSGAAAQAKADATAWTEQGHPRLFFTSDDVPELRERAQRQPFRDMLRASEQAMAPEGASDNPYDRSFHARQIAIRYVATGDRREAERAREAALEIIEMDRFLDAGQANALERAAYALNVALIYDWCHEAWDEDTRQLVSEKIKQVGEALMQHGGRGWPGDNKPGNNWHAVRYATAGLCFLATDEPGVAEQLDRAYDRLVRHLRANLGTEDVNGLNPEGIGYIHYPWQYTGPFILALKQVAERDLFDDVPVARNALWWYYVGVVNVEAMPFDGERHFRGLRADFGDDHPNWGHEGVANLAFALVDEKHLPGLRWMYDRLSGAQGDQFYDSRRGGAMWHLLYYPEQVPPRNPEQVWGLTWLDRGNGRVMFRNRYQDENDIVAQFNVRARIAPGGHSGPDGLGVRLLGLGTGWITGGGRYHHDWIRGQTTVYPVDPNDFRKTHNTFGQWVGEPTLNDTGDGQAAGRMDTSNTGVTNHHRTFAVDYAHRRQTGAAATFVIADTSDNGRYWRLNTPEVNEVERTDTGFVVTSPQGHRMVGHVLHPADAELRTGTLRRGSDFRLGGKKYSHNHWIDVPSDDGDFLVVLTLVERGQPIPSITAEDHLHGVTGKIGSLPLAWERESNTVKLGQEAASLDVSDRQTPLTPAPPQATALADTRIRLAWRAQETGGRELLVMRAVEGGPWEQIETLASDRTRFTDTQAEADTTYRYRLLARNAHGTSAPGEAVSVRTLERDHQLHVEDFAPRIDGRLPEANAFGRWRSVPAEGQRLRIEEAEGSPRHAAERTGYVGIGSVPLNANKLFYTTDVRGDLSSPSAVVDFDVLTQSATHFAILLRLADGAWVRGGGAIADARDWEPVTFRIGAIADANHPPARWHQVDIESLKTLEPVQVTADDLRDVRGIGVWVSWLINQRWARFDQLHVQGRDFQARRSEQER